MKNKYSFKNLSEWAQTSLVFLGAVALALLLLILLNGCQKESSFTSVETQVSKPVSCNFGITDEQFTEAARRFPNKGKGKPHKDTTAPTRNSRAGSNETRGDLQV